MKKIFAVGMSALLLAGACTLAACDEEEEPADEGNIVTAEEWAQAMDLHPLGNYSVKTMQVDKGGAMIGEEGAILKYDGLKWYNGYGDDEDCYCQLTGEASDKYGKYPCMSYRLRDGEWTVREVSWVYWDDASRTYTSFLYEEFTYDEEKGVYVAAANEMHYVAEGQKVPFASEGSVLKVEIQFKDKKLAHFDFFGVDEEGVEHISRIAFYDYGTTVVTLPDVPVNTVTAQQWEDAMVLKNKDYITFPPDIPWDNFSWKVTYIEDAESSDDGEVMMHCKYDYNAWYRYCKGITNEAGNYYIMDYVYDRVEHRIERVYESENGVDWTYNVLHTNQFLPRDENGILAMYTSVSMDDFTYDAEQGCYVATQGVHMKSGEDIQYTEFIEGQELHVKFRYGKLVCIEMILKYEGKTAITRIEIYDYGTTKVTLPTVG